MDKFRLTECQTLDIPVGNDVPLLVKLVKGFDGCDGEGAVPFPIDVCENVVVAMVSERGQVKSVAHRLGTDGKVLLELQAGDYRAGLTYGIDVRATLNGKAVHAYGKSLVRITAATERGPRQVAQASDPYEVTLFVGYIGSVIPSRLADLAADAEHRTVTDAEKNRWNNPPLPDLRDYATKEFARAVAQAEGVPMNFIGYHELKYLRDSFSLIPGRQYRIFDYVATTTQENTRSAGRCFDIIVTATGPGKLSEWARAARRGDYCYMCDSCDYCSCDSCDADWADYCRMESWLLLYCLDNDTSRFAWADDSPNGRGVVYWMRDEWGNEMPFDFKGIQFYALNTQWQVNPGGADVYYYYYYYYAFSNQVGGTVQSKLDADIYDASLDGTARRNVVKPCFEDGVQVLNSVLFVNLDELCGATIPFGEITENLVDFNCRDLMACTILYESWNPIVTYSRNIEVNKGFRNPRENFILQSDTRYGYPDQEDMNTTYKLSKSGSTITLTGSDGSSTSVADSNTTYTAMTQAEGNAGTGTTGRTITPKVLKATIEKHTEGKAAKGDLAALVQRYSVDEAVKVGEWEENGVTYDVMRKVFNFGNLPNAGEKAIDHGITDRVKFVRIWGTASDGKPLPLVTHDPTNAIYLTAGNSKITIQTGSADRSALTADVVVEYLRVNS